MATHRPSLETLAPELHTFIFLLLSGRDRSSLSRVSRILFAIGEPLVYRSIRITDASAMAILRRSMRKNPRRISWVRQIALSFTYAEREGLIFNLPNLRRVSLKADQAYCPSNVWNVMLSNADPRPPAFPRFANLTACYLSFGKTRNDIWSAHMVLKLLCLPSLRRLGFKGIPFNNYLPAPPGASFSYHPPADPVFQTPRSPVLLSDNDGTFNSDTLPSLELLYFVSCLLPDFTLSQMLAIRRARVLSIEYMGYDGARFASTLVPFAGDIEALAIFRDQDLPTGSVLRDAIHYRWPVPQPLGGFSALRTLSITSKIFFGNDWGILQGDPVLHLRPVVPPNLETLVLGHLEYEPFPPPITGNILRYLLEAKEVLAPRLRCIMIVAPAIAFGPLGKLASKKNVRLVSLRSAGPIAELIKSEEDLVL